MAAIKGLKPVKEKENVPLHKVELNLRLSYYNTYSEVLQFMKQIQLVISLSRTKYRHKRHDVMVLSSWTLMFANLRTRAALLMVGFVIYLKLVFH